MLSEMHSAKEATRILVKFDIMNIYDNRKRFEYIPETR